MAPVAVLFCVQYSGIGPYAVCTVAVEQLPTERAITIAEADAAMALVIMC
jgi:hypothetical protein